MNKREVITVSISLLHITFGISLWTKKEQRDTDENTDDVDEVTDMPEEKAAKK